MELGEFVYQGRVPFWIERQAYLLGYPFEHFRALLLIEIGTEQDCAQHQYDRDELYGGIHDSYVSFATSSVRMLNWYQRRLGSFVCSVAIIWRTGVPVGIVHSFHSLDLGASCKKPSYRSGDNQPRQIGQKGPEIERRIRRVTKCFNLSVPIRIAT